MRLMNEDSTLKEDRTNMWGNMLTKNYLTIPAESVINV